MEKRFFLVLKGGIGNQLFQYAFGQSIRNIHGNPLYLDATAYYPTPRRKILDVLGEKVIPYSSSIFKIITIGLRFRLSRWFLNTFGFHREEEFDPQKDKSIKYLDGYWQSASHIPSYLRENLNSMLNTRYRMRADEVVEHDQLCVHVRCGDFLKNDHHNVCDPSWYDRALEYIRCETDICVESLVVFTDDEHWVKKNLRSLQFAKYIPPSGDDLFDFFRMTKYTNFVIPNSTYSWWASYLAYKPQSIIICPSRWDKVTRTRDTGLYIADIHTII